jgi:hypothetical protein
MAAITLSIVKPAHGTVFTGTSPVGLQGGPVTPPPEAAGVALHYRWYSNLHPAIKENEYGLDPAGLSDPTVVYEHPLGVGTHILTFAATDQQSQSTEALKAVKHGGVTGGPPDAPHPCVVHVLRATIVAPPSGATLSKASSTLEARAPVLWDDPQYVKHNRVAFRWRLDPTPADGRAAGTLPPPGTALVFDKPDTGPVLRHQGKLPAALGVGAYRLTLRVELADDPAVGHESSIPVVIAA